MNCPKCNSYVTPEDSFCSVCGAKINKPNEGLEQVNVETTVNNVLPQDEWGFVDSSNQNVPNNSSDEELINAYIGNNAGQIKAGGFSWCMFFLGTYYLLYRKMWFLAILVFAIAFISGVFLSSYSSLISLGMLVYLGIKFNEIYLNHAREEVNKIKEANSVANKQELVRICKKKGGTTIIPIIVLIALEFFIVFGCTFIIAYLGSSY